MELDCITYFLLRYKNEMLKYEFLSEYSSYGPHGKRYIDA